MKKLLLISDPKYLEVINKDSSIKNTVLLALPFEQGSFKTNICSPQVELYCNKHNINYVSASEFINPEFFDQILKSADKMALSFLYPPKKYLQMPWIYNFHIAKAFEIEMILLFRKILRDILLLKKINEYYNRSITFLIPEFDREYINILNAIVNNNNIQVIRLKMQKNFFYNNTPYKLLKQLIQIAGIGKNWLKRYLYKFRISKRKNKLEYIYINSIKWLEPIIPKFINEGYSLLTNILYFSSDYKLAYKLGITIPNSNDHLYKIIPSNKKNLKKLNDFLKPDNVRMNGDRLIFKNIKLGKILEDLIHPLFFPISTALINRLDQFHNISQQCNLKSFVTWTDSGIINRALTLYASNNSIPSFVIQHGATSETLIFEHPVADYFLAWGENSKKLMMNFNVDEKKIILGGNPYLKINKKENTIIQNQKLYYSNKKVIIAISPLIGTGQVNYFETQKTMEVIINAASELPDIKFLWKLHRLDKYENYNINHKLKNFTLITGRLDKLFSNADILITIDSTAGIEAMVNNLPVIIMNVMNRKLYMDYVNNAGCIEIHNKIELIDAIRQFSNNTFKNNKLNIQNEYVSKYLFKYESDASKEIVNQITHIIH